MTTVTIMPSVYMTTSHRHGAVGVPVVTGVTARIVNLTTVEKWTFVTSMPTASKTSLGITCASAERDTEVC